MLEVYLLATNNERKPILHSIKLTSFAYKYYKSNGKNK